MKAYRAAILRFDPDADVPTPLYEPDGLLLVGPGLAGANGPRVVRAVGAYRDVADRFPGVAVEHLPGRLIAPGFVDLHIHYPQTDVIGSPAEGLLPWLERYTFPHESRFVDPAYATEVARFFLDELQRNGVTTALAFATSHPASVDALMTEAQIRGQRLIAGKVLQDRHSPDGVRDQTEQSLIDTETLIQRWHGKNRLGYAITPRFVPSCSDAQLRGAGELAALYPDVWVQSHVAENVDEIRWVRELHPQARSYLSVYGKFGLLRERAVYAHCIHLDDADRALLHDTGAAAAISPTSNLFLGSGFFDYASALNAGFPFGLASDVGGGTSFSPFHTMLAAYEVGRAAVTGGGLAKTGVSLAPSHLWWQHTAGAAQALGLGGVVGNLVPGCEADFVVLNPQATPLLARKTAQANSLEEWLFAMVVLGDDRLVERTVLAGAV
jgi:guanine deaminase